MACPKSYTEDGFQMQIGTNHFGHFELTRGLIPALIEGYKTSGRYSRVINVSSLLHAMSDINYEDINFKSREYDQFVSYGQSKTANVLFSVGISEKYRNKGIVSNAVMPGIISTGLQRHMNEEEWIKRGWMDKDGKFAFKFISIEQGAATSIWAAVAKELEGRDSLYLEKCNIAKSGLTVQEVFASFEGATAFAVDKQNAENLWNLSEKLIDNALKSKKASICSLL